VRINVNMDKSPLSELMELLENPEDALLGAGNGVKTLLQAHYRDKNQNEPNRIGGKRQNFWADVGRSVRGPVSEGGRIKVEITHVAIHQKIEGGKIKARRYKHLAIPIHKESYGKFVKPFERETGIELFFVEIKGTKFFASRSSGKFELYYVLKEQIKQDPWPGSLPTERQISQAAHDGATEVVLLVVSEA